MSRSLDYLPIVCFHGKYDMYQFHFFSFSEWPPAIAPSTRDIVVKVVNNIQDHDIRKRCISKYQQSHEHHKVVRYIVKMQYRVQK